MSIAAQLGSNTQILVLREIVQLGLRYQSVHVCREAKPKRDPAAPALQIVPGCPDAKGALRAPLLIFASNMSLKDDDWGEISPDAIKASLARRGMTQAQLSVQVRRISFGS